MKHISQKKIKGVWTNKVIDASKDKLWKAWLEMLVRARLWGKSNAGQ